MPKTERMPPEHAPLADVIELEDDRDNDSGLVETPEMPSDEKLAAKAPARKRTPRKPKADDAAAGDAPDSAEPERAAE